MSEQKPSERSIVRVGDGHGFVIAHGDTRVIITAAYCLPLAELDEFDGRRVLTLPPHRFSCLHERMFPKLVFPLGEEPTSGSSSSSRIPSRT